MVCETWVLPLVYSIQHEESGNRSTSIDLSVLRLARLMRLSRLTRLLRSVPEVVTLLKGIVQALWSVFFTLLLFMVLLYAFGIIFRSAAMDYHELRDTYFSSVPESMWTLMS